MKHGRVEETGYPEATVLRVKQVVHIGKRRFLVFTVENRGDGPLEIADVYLSVQSNGTDTPLKATWRMDDRSLDVAAEQRGVVAIPAKVGSKGARLKLRVEATQPARSIEQGGIGGL